MKTLIIGLAAAITASSAAQATVYTLTVSGTIARDSYLLNDEHDRAGLFGPAGASLAGLPFETVLKIDTSVWQLNAPGSSPTSIYFQSTWPADNAITGSVRIGTKTVRHIGEQVDRLNYEHGILGSSRWQSSVGGGRDYTQLATASYARQPSTIYTVNGVGHPGLQLGVNFYLSNNEQPEVRLFDGRLDPVPFALHFATADYNIRSGYMSSYSSSTGQFDAFYFDIADVSLVPSSVPEPESWALLIAGFGLVGAMARRRRGALRTMAVTF